MNEEERVFMDDIYLQRIKHNDKKWRPSVYSVIIAISVIVGFILMFYGGAMHILFK